MLPDTQIVCFGCVEPSETTFEKKRQIPTIRTLCGNPQYGDFDHLQTAHKKRFLPLQIPFWVTFFDFPKMTFRSS